MCRISSAQLWRDKSYNVDNYGQRKEGMHAFRLSESCKVVEDTDGDNLHLL